jgi:hypothetical protein
MLAEGGMGFTIVGDHNIASPYLWVAADLRLGNVSAHAQFMAHEARIMSRKEI